MERHASDQGEAHSALHSWRVRVSGRVQGVYYRAWTQETARRLGIRGWVRNEADGAVTALLQHEERAQLLDMLERMRSGPPAAEVLGLDVERLPDLRDVHTGFEITRPQ
jgi:acylphosphatase